MKQFFYPVFKRTAALLLSFAVLSGCFMSAAAESAAGQPLKDKFDEEIFQAPAADEIKYPSYSSYSQTPAKSAGDISIDLAFSAAASDGEITFDTIDGKNALIWEDAQYYEWSVEITAPGLYEIETEYYPLTGKGIDPQRKIMIDGDYPFSEAQNLMFYRNYAEDVKGKDGELPLNRLGNEIRPQIVERPKWVTTAVSNGQKEHDYPYRFDLSAGTHTIRLEMLSEPLAFSAIRLVGAVDSVSYAQKVQEYSAKGYADYSGENVKIQAEKAGDRSQSALRRENAGDLSCEPYSYSQRKLNIIGAENWGDGGSNIEWKIEAPKSGLYQISLHVYSGYNNGLPTYRQLTIDGEVPFSEMLAYRFGFNKRWYTETLADDAGKPYLFYLEKGGHTLGMTTTLSPYQPSIEQLLETSNKLNDAYREIRMLTGLDIDANFEYEFFKNIPDLRKRLVEISNELTSVSTNIMKISEKRPACLNDIDDILKLINAVIADDDKINKRIYDMSSAITDLGNLASNLRQQPIALDYFVFSKPGSEVKATKVSAWNKIAAFCYGFVYSFQADYTKVGVSGEIGEDTKVIDVWVGRGTQWVEILDQMIESDFTAKTGIVVNTNTIPAGQLNTGSVNALMIALVCGNGPDVALGVDSSAPVEFAIRGAAVDLSKFDDFSEVQGEFVPQLFTAVTYDKGIYALPETMNFVGLFYRKDILGQLGLTVPTTWQQVYDTVIPTLTQNSMQFYYAGGFDTFLYQNGGGFYSEDGRYTTLNSPQAFRAFNEWTALYTNYNIPIAANFFNRFRRGDTPIGIAGIGEYTSFAAFAPEIYGKWDVAPIPGVMREDGSIDNTACGILGSQSMAFSHSENKKESWEFLKWWMSADTQTDYQRAIEATLGIEARWSSANLTAFSRLPWPIGDSSETFTDMIKNSAVPPVYLGSYYTSRHIGNAFTRVVTMGETPRDSLEKAVKDINKELKSKNEEFGIYY